MYGQIKDDTRCHKIKGCNNISRTDVQNEESTQEENMLRDSW